MDFLIHEKKLVPLLNIPGNDVRIINMDDVTSIYQLLLKCSDYFLIVNGEQPGMKDALDILTDLPPGVSIENKYTFGISNQENKLAAILEIVKNYPDPNCWWIGLLLITPLERCKGLGKKIYNSLERWVLNFGAKEIRLGVIEQNENAIKFWTQLGFEIIEKRQPKSFGKLEHRVFVMMRKIT